MELRAQVSQTSKSLAGMLEVEEKQVERIIWHNASHVPYQEREDIVQEIAAKLVQTKPANAKLAFVIAKNLVTDWWRNYTSTRQFETFGLYNPIDGDEGITLEETLSSEYDYAKRLDSDIDAERLLNSLPGRIQSIIQKRLLGLGTKGADREYLSQYIRKHPAILA